MMSAPRAILKYGFDSELSCKVSGQEGGWATTGETRLPGGFTGLFAPPHSNPVPLLSPANSRIWGSRLLR